MGDWFRRYLLPGFVFEAAVIAGGYATGRELVEFFRRCGGGIELSKQKIDFTIAGFESRAKHREPPFPDQKRI